MNNPSNPAFLALLASVLLISTGCSKSSEGEVVDASGNAAAPAVPEKADPGANQAITTAQTAIEKNDYDAAIAALMAARQADASMSEEQKLAYRQSVRDFSTKLLEQSQNDPKAKEAYQNFGRLMKGR